MYLAHFARFRFPISPCYGENHIAANQVIITTTTLYPDPDGKDRVRCRLACKLCEEARKYGHIMVIADGSPDEVKEVLRACGAHVVDQEKGMGACRRQVWRETRKFVTRNTAGIFWTEEKPALVALLPDMLAHMRQHDAHVLIPARKPKSWASYPDFQVQSEATCLAVYRRYFGDFDPMFGPVLWAPEVMDYFIGCSAERCAEWGVTDTYLQHWVPIQLRSLGYKVVSLPVDWEQPPEQRRQEESEIVADIMAHRLRQLNRFVMGYLALRDHFGPMST